MDTTMEQRRKGHAQRLEAARVVEARRQERRVHIAPPRPVQDQAGRPMPTLSHYLELLAFLGDSGPAPTELEEAMERFAALRKARRARPLAPTHAVPERRGPMGSPTARPERPQDLEATSTQGRNTLSRVWQEASLADRESFRQWVNAQSHGDGTRVHTSTQTQRYAAEIARICGADTGPVDEEEELWTMRSSHAGWPRRPRA
jgi:hypothetical protein